MHKKAGASFQGSRSTTVSHGLLMRECSLGLVVHVSGSKWIRRRCCNGVYDIIFLPNAVRSLKVAISKCMCGEHLHV